VGDVVVIDARVIDLLRIELAHPICAAYWPVLEGHETLGVRVQFGRPSEAEGLAGIVEPVLCFGADSTFWPAQFRIVRKCN
jgi:hypothetical protein